MKIAIKSWLDGRVLWEGDAENMRHAIEQAIQSGANLTGADLMDADLTGADLTRANLTRANLVEANLTRANLMDANLTGADLMDANLTRANLTRANLVDANLTRANLVDANLTPIRDDIWAVLSSQPKEVQVLRDALAAGRINGSVYQGGCSCLVGTLANACHTEYTKLPTLKPNSSRAAERFFMMIAEGNTPENNQASRLAMQWVDEWLGAMRAAFGPVDSADASDRFLSQPLIP